MTEPQKWHVRADGTPARCHARKKCPLASAEAHASTREEALRKYEDSMAHNTLPSPRKAAESTKPAESLGRRAERRLKSERPRPLEQYPDRSLGVSASEVTVPHDPHARYAVLSDVDGTLTKGSLVLDHALYLHGKGSINLGTLPERWRADPKNEKLVTELAEAYRDAIVGKRLEDLEVEQFLEGYEADPTRFYSTLEQLKTFKQRGWEVQLISGSPSYLVEPFAKSKGFYGKGSEYATDEEGRLTGEVEGMFGHEAKRGFIQKLVVSRFKRVLAFGDTSSDVPLFESAHHSTLVAPSEETASKVEASLTVWE